MVQNTQVLKQMLFHGKKTVPEAVRRDMWTPYFSVHFPENSAGASVGLEAFKSLRELSTQRQLSPDRSLLTATQNDVDVAKSKLGGPLAVYRLEQSDNWREKRILEVKLPKAGELLPKKLRAKRLMDQKATSVADVAFVLDRISSGPGPLQKMIALEIDRVARHKERSKRSRTRVNTAARELSKKETKIESVAQLVLGREMSDDILNARFSSLQMDRLSLEHQLAKQALPSLASSSRYLVDDGRARSLSKASELWELLNPVDPALIDVEEYKERRAVSQAAEHEALKTWHSPESQASNDPATSMWTYVKEKREAALASFDENFLERKKSAALSQAAAEATTEYEALQKAAAGAPAVSMEDLVSSKQAAALKKIEAHEVARRQKLNRAIEEATVKLLNGTPPAEDGPERSSKRTGIASPQPESPWSNTWNIKMYWADLNDGTFAKNWPQAVVHDLLEPYAATRTMGGHKGAPIITNKSVHVMGHGLHEGFLPRDYLMGPRRPEPKVPREQIVPFLEAPLPHGTNDDMLPTEQPPPPESGIIARLRKAIFGR